MRILITTGIFEPEAGGPATYTPKIAEKLVDAGHDVTVVTYSNKERYDFDSRHTFRLVRVVRGSNKFSNYFAFFRVMLRELSNVDIAYSLDWIAAGLPLVIAAAIKKVPVVIRVGGDYVWERYLQHSLPPMPLTKFYEQSLHKDYGTLTRLITFVLRRAHVIFNTDMQRNMYQKFYGLKPEKTSVIYNPTPEKGWLGVKRERVDDEIVFAGRFIVMKNIVSLLEAFAKAHIPYKLVLIGGGPDEHRIRNAIQELHIANRVTILPTLSQAALYERVKNCRALVLPSWSDIAPNQVSEAIAIGIPILVTKENFLPYRDQLPEMIDPSSVEDIAKKLEMLANEERYGKFAEKCALIRVDQNWDTVLKEHIRIFQRITSKQDMR